MWGVKEQCIAIRWDNARVTSGCFRRHRTHVLSAHGHLYGVRLNGRAWRGGRLSAGPGTRCRLDIASRTRDIATCRRTRCPFSSAAYAGESRSLCSSQGTSPYPVGTNVWRVGPAPPTCPVDRVYRKRGDCAGPASEGLWASPAGPIRTSDTNGRPHLPEAQARTSKPALTSGNEHQQRHPRPLPGPHPQGGADLITAGQSHDQQLRIKINNSGLSTCDLGHILCFRRSKAVHGATRRRATRRTTSTAGLPERQRAVPTFEPHRPTQSAAPPGAGGGAG